MRQRHKAGERLFVDYAGQTIEVADPEKGGIRETQLFLAVLGASSYTYAEATWTQGLPDWIGSHVRAFEFFKGVSEVLVPDNLKSGVTSPCRYEPELNPTYRELADHYGISVIPATVSADYHLEVDGHYYSVPFRLIRQKVDIRIALGMIECFQKGVRVAGHARSERKGDFSTVKEHMPPSRTTVSNKSGPANSN